MDIKMASCKCWKCRNSHEYKQSHAHHMNLHSEEDDAYEADTDDDNDHDNKRIKKEINTNISKRYDGFGHCSCQKCS